MLWPMTPPSRMTAPPPRADAQGGSDQRLSEYCGHLMATRRSFLTLMATAGLAPAVVSAQGAAKVVVVGGGFAGAACARALRKLDPEPRRHAGRVGQDLQRLPVQQLGDRGPARAGAAGILLRLPRRARHQGGDRRRDRRRSGREDRDARRRRQARLGPAGDRAGRRHELDGDRGLHRSGGREDAARLDRRAADPAAAPPARGDGRTAGWS